MSTKKLTAKRMHGSVRSSFLQNSKSKQASNSHMTKGRQKMAKDNGSDMQVAAQEFDVPLKDVIIDHDWNSRNKGYMTVSVGADESCGPDEGRGLSGLIDSIRNRGQDSAAWVVPAEVMKRKGGKFFLVAGYRRAVAIARIAEAEGNKNPTIRVVIKDFKSEQEVRAANLRENVDRDNLSGADLAWGVADLVVKQGMTQAAAAAELGKTQSYISKLYRIMTKVNASTEVTLVEKGADGKEKTTKKRMPIVQAWRESVAPVTIDDMVKLSEAPIDRQEEEWQRVSSKERPKGRDKWIETAEKAVIKQAFMLGMLEFQGAIDATGIRFTKTVLRTLANFKDDATDKQIEKLATAAKEGLAEVRKGPPVEKEKNADKQAQAEN